MSALPYATCNCVSRCRCAASALTSSVSRQRRQQRLRLGDLRHFGRRRKAFERRREDGVGVGGAAGRLIELRQRQRRAQFKTARPLLLRDRDGGQEGFFRGRGLAGSRFNRISPRTRCRSASNAR